MDASIRAMTIEMEHKGTKYNKYMRMCDILVYLLGLKTYALN